MKQIITELLIIPILVLIFVPLTKEMIKSKPVDICKTPIYKLSVNELNQAVVICKANKAEIRRGE